MSNEPHEPPIAPIELSVVIPAFNASGTIAMQLGALSAEQWDGAWEVVVADNGSTDGTPALVAEIAANDRRFRLVDASDRRGASHARNVGVGASLGRSIAFCDADDVVATGWVGAFGDALRRASFVTGPQDHELLNEPWLHGAFGTRAAIERQMFEGIFPFGPTANLGIRRDVLDSVGGFDESIAVYEDLELCLRLWLDDVELDFVPEAVVNYRYREQLRELWKQARTYGAASPAIARRLADAGRPTPSRWSGAKNWIWLVRRLPSLHSRAARSRWVVVSGTAVGRLTGSVRSRYLMF